MAHEEHEDRKRYQQITDEDRLIAGNIRERMKRVGVRSVEELADGVGLPRPTLSNYLNAATRIPSPVLKRIAKRLQCSADYLLGLEEEDRPAMRSDILRIEWKLLEITSALGVGK